MGPVGGRFMGRAGMSPRGAWELQTRGKGEASPLKRGKQIVTADLSSGAALPRLSRTLGHVTFVAPFSVGHSLTYTPLGRDGKVWGQ